MLEIKKIKLIEAKLPKTFVREANQALSEGWKLLFCHHQTDPHTGATKYRAFMGTTEEVVK